MSLLDGLRHRLRVWTRRADYEREIAEEVQFHLSLDTARLANPDDARRRFGNVTYLTEETRRMSGLASLDALTQDARQMVRSLKRSPGFATVAILTLALGIGVTTAVLSVVDHVLVHAIPLRDPDRVMYLLERDSRAVGAGAGSFRAPSPPTAAEVWQRDPGTQRAFSDISFVRGEGASFQMGEINEHIAVGFVGPEFFRLLGATPIIGRTLIDDDHRDGAPGAAVLQNWFWRKKLGSDPSTSSVRRSISTASRSLWWG